jgi:hypothetical protein
VHETKAIGTLLHRYDRLLLRAHPLLFAPDPDFPMRPLVALISLLLLTLPALAEGNGETRKYFKDWLAACRPDGYCSATAYVNPGANGTVADYIFRVGRQAQQTYWEVSFTAVATDADAHSDFIVTIDGKPESFSQPQAVAAYGSINDFYFLGDRAQRLMDRLPRSTAANVAFTDRKGVSESANFSLSGLGPALSWIDDQQHRIGSERVAEAPPYGLDPAAAPPASTAPAALLARLAADPQCAGLADARSAGNIGTAPIDATHTLYILPCAAEGGNASAKLFVESGGAFSPLFFADYDGTGSWAGTDQLQGVAFDSNARVVTSFSKLDATGNCGSRGVWIWNQDYFRLSQYRFKPGCDGKADDFPVIFTAPPLPQIAPN